MKNIGFVVLIIFSSLKIIGQPDRSEARLWRVSKCYGSVGAVIANPGTFGKGSGGLYFKNQWGLTFDGMQTYHKAKNLPAGYKTRICLFGNCTPKDKMQIFSLQPGREFNLRGERTFILLGAGPSYVVYEETQFRRATSGGFGCFSKAVITTAL